MQIKTRAIVLKGQDYNENDRLLTLLTEDRGVIFVYAFGARKMKNRFSTVSSMLCYGEFVLFENKGKYNLDSADSECLFFGIRQDLESLAYASYFSELCLSVIPAEEPSRDCLRLLLNTLYMLERKKVDPAVLKAIFELRVMSMIGYEPNLVACSSCGDYQKSFYWFNKRTAAATCSDCQPKPGPDDLALSQPAFLAARHIVYAPMEQLFRFKIGEQAKIELSVAAENYTLFQLDKKLPTLDFLNSIRTF